IGDGFKVGDNVVVADADARLVQRLEYERVVAGPASHDVVTGAADDRVVAGPATDRVAPRTPRQGVIAVVAGDDVGQAVAGAVDVGGAGQHQVLEVVAEREGNGAAHGIDAAVGSLDQGSAAVGDVGVITRTTGQRVVAAAAI